jgi:multiple sugar transport system permease protein
MKPTEPRPFRWDAFLRGMVIYGLLLAGSAMFVWPLLWMLGTSFKSQNEIVNSPTTFLPRQPVPRAQSPYLESRTWSKPTPEDAALLPAIEDHLRGMNYPWPSYTPPENSMALAAQGIVDRLRNILPASDWKLPPAELAAKMAAHIDAPLVDQVTGQLRRELCFASLRIESVNFQSQDLVPDNQVTGDYDLQGGNKPWFESAKNEGRDCGLLHYDFGGDQTIRLTHLFQTDFTVDQLKRLQLSVRSDESWNALDIYVEKQGVLYKSSSPTVLGAPNNWRVLTWQQPSKDDGLAQMRVWLALREVDRGPQYVSGPNQMRVTFEIRRATVLGAWGEKMSRNYGMVLTYIPFWRYVGTSFFLVIMNVTATLFSCSIVAYSFARLKWPGRSLCVVLMLATLMIPQQITMIPQFLIARQLGWYNTLLPLWVPSLFGNAFFIFLLVQFFRGIPKDLEEAARIDGCGFFRIYWHIMLPLVRPTLAAIAVLTFVGSWNDFMGPLIYVSDQQLYPLSFGLYAFTVQAAADAGLNMSMTMAGALLMAIPVIGLFLVAQRYFIQGVTLSGIK